jgi:hypothetical protein
LLQVIQFIPYATLQGIQEVPLIVKLVWQSKHAVKLQLKHWVSKLEQGKHLFEEVEELFKPYPLEHVIQYVLLQSMHWTP